MAKVSKRAKNNGSQVEAGKAYSIAEAFALSKSLANVKFDESIDVAIKLGVDPRKSDQVVRSATILPNGTGKSVRVAVIAEGDSAEQAKAAGADLVGYEDLAETIKGGEMAFDVLIATPGAMRLVGQLGQILGPRGLMPNPKVGTVTQDVAKAVSDAKKGQVRYRTDKNGIIHCLIGKATFTAEALSENLNALITDLKKIKPSAAKGTYIRKIVVSSTMGPAVVVDRSPF